MMGADLWSLYALMRRSRLFEVEVSRLWQAGLISGEMHLGTGEEAVIAGVVSQLRPGDAMALDHRGSAAFLMRGVDPISLLREMLGRGDGLCGGRGGHMHLFSPEHLAASSGIVGASGPTAAGFALAAQHLRPGAVAVAFFGEGALNQGMLMESVNLAAVWRLPVVFVCKDDGWAITTEPASSTAGTMDERVRGLGAEYQEVDGLEVERVWHAARQALERARAGMGPTFLRARCVHLEGHFLGFPLIRSLREPLRELPAMLGPLIRALLQRKGGSLRERLAGVRTVFAASLATLRDRRRQAANDPVLRARSALTSQAARLQELDVRLEQEAAAITAAALQEVEA